MVQPTPAQRRVLGATNAMDTQNPTSIAGNGVPVSLSANQIFAILEQQPDTVVELKSLMADLASQQGTPLQPDSITDQMLYSKIASSPELRANITTFMRARGYVSDADLESYVASGNVDDVFSSLQGSQIPGRPLAADRLPSNPSRTTNSHLPPASPEAWRRTAPRAARSYREPPPSRMKLASLRFCTGPHLTTCFRCATSIPSSRRTRES